MTGKQEQNVFQMKLRPVRPDAPTMEPATGPDTPALVAVLEATIRRLETELDRLRADLIAERDERRRLVGIIEQATATPPPAAPVSTGAAARRPRRQMRLAPAHPGFDAFWSAYPRKVAKAAARIAWDQLAPTAELVAAMLAALAWQRDLPNWQDADFIPHAATWLHQRRWEDERPADADPYQHLRRMVVCHNPNCPLPPDIRAHWEGEPCPGQ